MFIVHINGEKHSAWNTLTEARRQRETLKNYGYKGLSISNDTTVSCENGHYFV